MLVVKGMAPPSPITITMAGLGGAPAVFAFTTAMGMVGGGLTGGMYWTRAILKDPGFDTAVRNVVLVPGCAILGMCIGAAAPIGVASLPLVGVTHLLEKNKEPTD